MLFTGGYNRRIDIMNVNTLKKIRDPIQLPEYGLCSLLLGHTLIISGRYKIIIYPLPNLKLIKHIKIDFNAYKLLPI